DLLKAAQPLHILTVSDMDDFAESGGVIGLVTRNGRGQFNINARAARTSGLSISAELMGLARQVIGQESG
ncbi:YfiR family protein, partial [Acinetobacter baumannii]